MLSKSIRWVVWTFVLSALAVGLALAGRYGTGYAVLVIPPWRIELSIMLFLILLLAVVAFSYAAVSLSVRAWQLPQAMKRRERDRERMRVAEDLHESLRALFGGRFDDAEKLAKRAMSAREGDPAIRDLGAALAAWAAHEGGNLPAALPYLEQIGEGTVTGAAARMRDASKAYMLLAEGRASEALPILQSLAVLDPTNVGVLKMKVEAEIAAKAWSDVLLTLGPLKRTGLIPAQAAEDIRLNAEIELIRSRPAQRDVLLDAWSRLDSAMRYQPGVVDALVLRLMQLGLGEEAAKVIEETIAKRGRDGWEPLLVARYAEAKSDSTLSQIGEAEKWLVYEPRDPVLLATLGKLCMRQALWGKAQSYLEASVALAPSLDAHMTLARLMEQVGKPQEAMRHIRRSADLARATS